MASYNPPIDFTPSVFNVSQFINQNDAGLTIGEADLRYARLKGYNSYTGTNNFFNFVSLFATNLNFYDGTNSTTTASINSTTGTGNFSALQINGVDLSTMYAPIYSPHFTGIPTVPDTSANTQSTQIANCNYVNTAISNLINGSPALLDTLNELSVAINNDPTFSTTILNLIATKQNILNSSNRLDASYVGNGDVTNTILSYMKNVTYDINTAITTLNTKTTNISYTSGMTSINNNLNINRNTFYLSDVSNVNSNYASQFYSGSNLYFANGAGSTNSSANTIFRFFTVSPSTYNDPVSINYQGITTNGLTVQSTTINANAGLTIPSGQLLTLNGNLFVNSTSITPSNLSQLSSLNQNVQSTLTTQTNSINAINQTLTNVSYTALNQTTNVTYYTAFNESTINNNLSVGGLVTIGSDILIGGNIVCSGNIITPNQSINYRAGYLYLNSMSLPVIRSIPNTSMAFTNLDLQSLMGTTGNNLTVSIYPLYKIQFVYSTTILCTIDNTNGLDCLYSTVVFGTSSKCTSINVFYNGVQI